MEVIVSRIGNANTSSLFTLKGTLPAGVAKKQQLANGSSYS